MDTAGGALGAAASGALAASAAAEAVAAVEAVGVAAAEGASYAWRALVRTSLMGGAMGKYGTRRRFHPWGCWMALLHAVDFGGGRVLWVNTSHGSAPQADRATQVD